MNSQGLTIVGFATVAEEHHELFLAISAHMISVTRRESGCLQSNVYQDKTYPNKFMLHEIWQDEKSWTTHLQQRHIANFSEQSHMIGTDFEIRKFEYRDL